MLQLARWKVPAHVVAVAQQQKRLVLGDLEANEELVQQGSQEFAPRRRHDGQNIAKKIRVKLFSDSTKRAALHRSLFLFVVQRTCPLRNAQATFSGSFHLE